MTQFNINKVSTFYKNISGVKSIDFDYLGNKVYAAQKIENIYGVFISLPVNGGSGLVSWEDLIWTGTKPTGTDVWLYVKSSTTIDGLDGLAWSTPYLNTTNDISSLKSQYLQFMIVLSSNLSSLPLVDSIELTYNSSENAARFYTKAFNLGFVPKHILLTYNGEMSSDAIVKFAVSGFDSVDSDDYQYIDPNKIEELTGLSVLSDKIKLMIEMIGDSGVPITIHEVALMFSGESQLYINDISSSSSSFSSYSSYSSSSSSSSYIENWSSSSSSSSL